MVTTINLRAVFRNDPVPTLPFKKVMDFYHVGREVHFYDCKHMNYIAYPPFKDDNPATDLTKVSDHLGYMCIGDDQTEYKPAPFRHDMIKMVKNTNRYA